jgi:hypothetical protein
MVIDDLNSEATGHIVLFCNIFKVFFIVVMHS